MTENHILSAFDIIFQIILPFGYYIKTFILIIYLQYLYRKVQCNNIVGKI